MLISLQKVHVMQIQQTITLEPQDLVDALQAHIQKTLGVDAEVVVSEIALPESTQVAYTLQVNSITKVKAKTRGAATAPAEGGKRRGRKPKAQVEAEQAAANAVAETDTTEYVEPSNPMNVEIGVDLGSTESGTFEAVGAVHIEPVEPPSHQEDNPFNVEAPTVIGSSVFGG